MRTLFGKNRFIYAVILFFSVFTVFMTCVSPASMWQGLGFLAYQLLAVLLPGMALVYALRLPVLRDMEVVAWGYGLGQALSVAQYFLLAAAGRLDLAFALQCMIVLGGGVYLLFVCIRRKLPPVERTSGRETLTVLGFAALSLTIRFFTYYSRNLLPEPGHDVVFPNQDILFYIGNAISAGKGFPVQEFRFAGQQFRYHYFGSLMLEMASKTTGIPELTLEFCFSWIQAPFLLVTGFWCLMRRMRVSGKWCALGEFLLLFTTGWELIVYIAFQEKMYVSPFGYDVGLAFAVLTVTFMLVQCDLERMHFGVWASVLLAFTLCTGAKAPVAVVILVFLGGVCALWLFGQRKAGQALAYGIPLVAVFVFLFFTVVSEGMSTVSHNQTGLFFSLTGHLYECGLGRAYYDMVEKGMPGILGKILIILAYFFGANPVIYGLFYPALFCRVRREGRKALFSVDGSLVASVAAGMLLTLFTKQSGNSQMYFAMTAMPFAAAYDMRWLTDRRRGKSGAEIIFRGAVAAALLASVGCWFHILWVHLEEGCVKLARQDVFEDVNNSITWEEYEAFLWIRDHTEEDAVMLCNTAMHDQLYENFIVGVCTERQMWIEGWRYVAGYLDQESIQERRDMIGAAYAEGKALETAERAGAEYVIWIRRLDPQALLSPLEDRKIYDNESVAVYQID
ncbi:MAG: hypothetical protein NC121_04260 [Blautia sp.]|nr:hypothetical protein [Blautia sp.]